MRWAWALLIVHILAIDYALVLIAMPVEARDEALCRLSSLCPRLA